jgi:TRAP-type C4-dicarboxylate transport system permease small subunit
MTGDPAAAASPPPLPGPLRVFGRLLDAATAAAKAAVVVILAGLVVVVASQFVDRYVTPVWGGVPADEYVKVGLIWLTFLGFGIAIRAGVAVRVDLVDHLLPPKLRHGIETAIDVVLVGVLAIVLWKGARLYAISTGQLILGTDMTVAVPTLGMLLGLGLTALAVIERSLRRFARGGRG